MLGTKVVAFEPQAICADFLEVVTAGRNDFTLVRKALGASEGQAEMLVSDINVISTLSREWQAATQASGRFGDARYNGTQMVEMTTLDNMIEKFGCPRFIKIDVEGYEYEVLSGLSRPVQYISVEFTPEFKESANASVRYFDSLVNGAMYQLSRGESLEYALDDWVSRDEMLKTLEMLGHDFAGDVYMRSGTE
jgi:FkbM family methyltransferase